MIKKNLISVIAHVTGWLLFFSLVAAFVYKSDNTQTLSSSILSISFLGFCLIYLLVFYINTWVLIPEFYLKKRYFIYSLFVLCLLAAVYLLSPFDGLMKRFNTRPRTEITNQMPPPPMDAGPPPTFNRDQLDFPTDPGPQEMMHTRRPVDFASIIIFLAVWSFSTAICIIREWRRSEQRVVQAEADKANAQLTFLKAQINPHFLFNTLNNIYSLAVTQNDNTAPSILKLSNIMRYMTDDSREDFVPLDSEIDCIKDYIDLQRLRLGKKMNIHFDVSGVVATKRIAPLILMTFIENAFKHGISAHEPFDISMDLVANDDSIVFHCQNKLYENRDNLERVGIGMNNTRQRLEYLYPGKHKLETTTNEGIYRVSLTLQS